MGLLKMGSQVSIGNTVPITELSEPAEKSIPNLYSYQTNLLFLTEQESNNR